MKLFRVNVSGEESKCQTEVTQVSLIEILKNRTSALKVADLANLFGVTPQHVYKMAASGRIPSFRLCGSVRFDPHEVAGWLAVKQTPLISPKNGRRPSMAA